MIFSSAVFLYYFLPLTVLVYFLAPKRAGNYILLAASLIFYFFSEPIYIFLLLFSALCAYAFGLLIEKYRKHAKALLVCSVVLNAAILGFFKYADFFIETANGIFGTNFQALRIALPIGISFYTFQTMSYTIDVYRKEAKAEHNAAALSTYVSFFPQLIAGPIVRYTDISAELKSRTSGWDDIGEGIMRFTVGLSKKVLIANVCGELCDVFRNSDERTILFYWVYAIAFMLQIYFDFSGYSDMAIGLGRISGFKFPENFNYPYISSSITEFWRRWHMTLGGLVQRLCIHSARREQSFKGEMA